MASGKKKLDGKLTIGELARRTGMTIRNIRAHQTRGLLPPPEVHGRTGYYNEDHVARIELTREMQAEGLNLEAIRLVLEGSEGSSREMVDFARAIRAPFEDETPEIFDEAELAAAWQVDEFDQKLLKRSEDMGILRRLPEGKIEVISPRLQHAGTALVELGVPPQAAVKTAEELRRCSERVARTFVELFVREIWEPFDKAGRPDEDWPKVREALDRMRP
ncbi:MAG TPA: MerR family transcriptional regulator, partial [Solirubrobacterales bacterium]